MSSSDAEPRLVDLARGGRTHGRPLLVVPLGSTEQHGPHLPLDTDTRIAVAVAEGLAHRRGDVTVAPALAYGSSGEHAGFAGTLSIGQTATSSSWSSWCDRPTRSPASCSCRATAATPSRSPGPWPGFGPRVDGCCPGRRPVAGGDAHAGRTETSLLLAIAPSSSASTGPRSATPRRWPSCSPTLRAEGVQPVSPNGVLGDPPGASADEGRAALERLVDDLDAAIEALVAE